MKKALKIIAITLLFVGIIHQILKQNKPKNIEDMDNFPKETSYKYQKESLQCVLEKIVIKERSEQSEPLKGSNYLKQWYVKIENSKFKIKESYLITAEEDPLNPKQEILVASNCKQINEETKKQIEKDVEDGCAGLYLWDKANYQISRQCGHIVNDNVYFIKYKPNNK